MGFGLESVAGVSILKLWAESFRLNRKAYILKLFIGLVCAEPNVLFSQPNGLW
jgi:hypothetical protein